ncbi:unnamed protein product [Caenorhabditis auriculariae]|uniref:Metalloendopeptidase n=1 Tax=Caenorhabditis auriculariae TaxID=2777116 RepID=A0A8S1GPZ4_9PELO|nr:unnamed protein product [Caenorhabditis auriculariae]
MKLTLAKKGRLLNEEHKKRPAHKVYNDVKATSLENRPPMLSFWVVLSVFLPAAHAQGREGGGGLPSLFGGGPFFRGRPPFIPPPQPPPGFFPGGGPRNLLEGAGRLAADITQGVFDTVGGAGHDVADDFDEIRKGKRISVKTWRRKARRFCRRFPGHPHCRKGVVPNIGDINEIVTTLSIERIGKFLPKVPRIKTYDPLKGIDHKLKDYLKGVQLNLGEINVENVLKIKDICKRRKCREQPAHAKKKRQFLANKLIEFEKATLGKDNSEAIQLRLDRTLQLKEALLEKGNLSDIVTPVDDGVFDSDMMLTENQANYLLNELNKAGEGADEIPLPETDSEDSDAETEATAAPTPAQKARRSSIFFEEHLIQKWPSNSPIRFVFDSSLEEVDKSDVRGAILEIEQKTCIRFQELKSAPSGPHIMYYKVDSPTFCGLSYVGKVDPANPVYLSFGCPNSRGVAVHETMHALGVAHQHLRADRDQFITINWNNIDPQNYDAFVVVDSKLYSSYGVKYAYDSIMHYNAYTAAHNTNTPTMSPKVNSAANLAIMGQRNQMSPADVELLKKMYCSPGCDDKNVYCGAWALQTLCTNPSHDKWMSTNCPKSCNLCSKG